MGQVLAPGVTAPDFTLHVTPDQTLSLADLRGRPVVLAFYPADWSPVCGDQMAVYNQARPRPPADRRGLRGATPILTPN
ncbi:redoxin domain-containing protein [Methylobacterium sp. CM6246]